MRPQQVEGDAATEMTKVIEADNNRRVLGSEPVPPVVKGLVRRSPGSMGTPGTPKIQRVRRPWTVHEGTLSQGKGQLSSLPLWL